MQHKGSVVLVRAGSPAKKQAHEGDNDGLPDGICARTGKAVVVDESDSEGVDDMVRITVALLGVVVAVL
jgi:hypothetical protein